MASLKKRDTRKGSGPRHSLRCLSVLLLAGLGSAACDTAEFLAVELPGQVIDVDLDDSSLAQVLVNSVIADVECAWSHYVGGSANHSDEYIGSSGNDSMSRWGLRQITPDFKNYANDTCDLNWGHAVYTPMHTARFQADNNFALISGFPDAEVAGRGKMLATVKAYGGWPLVAFGETFCESRFDGGPILTRAEVLAMAEKVFTDAIALAASAGETNIGHMARAGRARARLGLLKYADAITDASAIPASFSFDVTTSASNQRRYNRIRKLLNGTFSDGAGWAHAAVSFGYRDVKWKNVADPRVKVWWDGVSLGIDGSTEHYVHDKHTTLSTPNELASYRQSQMVIAEASALSGDLTTAIGILNNFHTAAGIPAVTAADIPTQDDVINHVIEERRREFFVEGGHRLRDHIRWRGTAYNVPFLGEAGSDLPNGYDHIGSFYGDATCYPIATADK